MKISVIAIEPFDGHHPGERIDVTEREARQLDAKGLIKMALGAPENKMASGPKENKAGPSPAAGQVAQSSAPPVAQASPRKTLTLSRNGKPLGRPPGRSSR